MMHVGIFPSWECQLRCVYCSIRNSKIDRTVQPVAWQEWARALPKYVPAGSIVDVAGGEPLLYPGCVDLLHSIGKRGILWAITTNAKRTDAVRRLCEEQPRGCVCINVSDHASNADAHNNIQALKLAGYRVNVHRVDHPAAGHHEADAHLITYQDWSGGRAVDGIRRRCDAGLRHWVADPRGDLWRCVVALETGQPSVGNLFTGETEPTDALCTFGCSTAYTEDPASWCVQMEPIEGAA